MPPARPPAPPLPLGCRHDGVDDFDDAVQSRVSADGHVCPAEVVVDGAHHAHDVEVPVLLHILLGDLACEDTATRSITGSMGAARGPTGTRSIAGRQVGQGDRNPRLEMRSLSIGLLFFFFFGTLRDLILYPHGNPCQTTGRR